MIALFGYLAWMCQSTWQKCLAAPGVEYNQKHFFATL